MNTGVVWWPCFALFSTAAVVGCGKDDDDSPLNGRGGEAGESPRASGGSIAMTGGTASAQGGKSASGGAAGAPEGGSAEGGPPPSGGTVGAMGGSAGASEGGDAGAADAGAGGDAGAVDAGAGGASAGAAGAGGTTQKPLGEICVENAECESGVCFGPAPEMGSLPPRTCNYCLEEYQYDEWCDEDADCCSDMICANGEREGLCVTP